MALRLAGHWLCESLAKVRIQFVSNLDKQGRKKNLKTESLHELAHLRVPIRQKGRFKS